MAGEHRWIWMVQQAGKLWQWILGCNSDKAGSSGRPRSILPVTSRTSFGIEDPLPLGNQWVDGPGRERLSVRGLHDGMEWGLGVFLRLLGLECELGRYGGVAQIVQVAPDPEKDRSD